MATTTKPPERATNGVRPRTPQVEHRPAAASASIRNRTRILVGVLLAFGSAFAAAVLYAGAGDRTPALAVAHPIAAGQMIEGDDLREVTVAVDDGVEVVPASHLAEIVGSTATVALAPGSLLSPTQVGDAPSMDSSDAVFGATLAAGSYPSGLRVGDDVLLFELPTGTDGPEDVPAVSATVVGVQAGEAAGGVSATFAVAPGDAGAMAIAAGQGRLIVVLAPR